MKKRIDSFRYAIQGGIDLLQSQPNARIHAICALLVLFAGYFFQISWIEWSVVTMAIGAVFAAEAFNTAIEYLTDLVSPEYHTLAGKTKDAAAAGVLFTAIGAAITGLIIFLPKLWNWYF